MFRELTRKKQRLTDEECKRVLIEEKRGVLSVNGDDGYPYGMPMNHYYDEKSGKIYFHCGKKGYRTDALAVCNKASFCVYDGGCRTGNDWALTVKSVIVFGKIKTVDSLDKIVEISAALSRKFTDDEGYIQTEIENFAQRTLLLELTPEHICGKKVKES